MNFPAQFFITGTDTGVGKTVVSAILLAGLSYKYWKPVQCGLLEATDTEVIKNITGLHDGHFLPEKYRLPVSASPHISAAAANVTIDMESLRLPAGTGDLLVEGAGGLLVPLNARFMMIDLLKLLGLPVLLVARSGLGTINHTLLSLAALRDRDVEVLGVVLNGAKAKHQQNRRAIEYYGKVQVIAELEPLTWLTPVSIMTAFKELFL
ncbi:MAG: dethiobiotin synthase [Deltaproteobacteria bacterium]|nr:dethiobiotin synthase [Deltaproteobacteria bacterium]